MATADPPAHDHYIALAVRLEQLAFTLQTVYRDPAASIDCLEAAQFIRDRLDYDASTDEFYDRR